jgi:hypothetical protein
VALLGLFAGLTFYSPSKPIPFRGAKRLHMVLGLFFGFLACTWAFSGMLSMDPFPIKVTSEDPRIPEALEGESFAFESFAHKSPREALSEISPALNAKEVEFGLVDGRAFYIITQDAAHMRVVPVDGPPAMELDRQRLIELVRKASQPIGIAEARFIDQYDAHYLDRTGELPLPVLYVRMNDPQQSRFYIDPRTARVVGSYSADRWPERWLYHGFHSINLPLLYKHRPAWDIAVLFLMLGGASLSVTSVIIGWRFVIRRL